jgi:hypothetical protein
MKHLKVMADYHCFPIWDIDEPNNIDPHTLPLSEALIAKLMQWAARYDNTLNTEYPPSSGFLDTDSAVSFIHDGKDLTESLRNELSDDYSITYVPDAQVRPI